MEQNKLLNKPFKQIFHITDIKHNIIGIPFITKHIQSFNILDSKININDKYTRMQNTASSFGIGAALLKSHNGTNEMNLISANSRIFTQAELRLSTLMRECTAIIYTLTDYYFLILGSKHPTVLFTDHKPIIFLFTKKSIPNYRVYRFQLILMKFSNHQILI